MRSLTRWLTASVVLLAFCCQVHAANLALVVGIDSFPLLPPKAQLQRAVTDANAVGDALQELGFNVTRVTRDASLNAIYDAFDQFTHQIQRGDTVVLYYAGRGTALDDGTYLLPADFPSLGRTDARIAKRHAFAERDLKSSLHATGARAVVVVLDARPIDDGPRGLARSEAGYGFLEIEAAREGQTALDRLSASDPIGTSVFARVFVKVVKTPGISLDAFGGAVRDEVASLARGINVDQVPVVSDDLIGAREIYLAGRGTSAPAVPTPVAPPPVAPAPVASAGTSPDAIIWSIIKGTSDPKQIDSFLAQFPQSPLRAEAEARRDELRPAPVPAPVAEAPVPAAPPAAADATLATCDQLAAVSFDPTRPAGVAGHGADELATLDGGAAAKACRAALAIRPTDPRLKLQLGFALLADVEGRLKVASGDPQAPALARESLDLLKQSSEAGIMAARTLLGFTTIEGSDEAAKPKGLQMVREAATAGIGFADDVLGYAYEQGLGVAVDKVAALNWYRKGVDLGDPGSKADYDRLSQADATPAETAPATPAGPIVPAPGQEGANAPDAATAPAPPAPVAQVMPFKPGPLPTSPEPAPAAPDATLTTCDQLAAVAFDPTRPAGVPGHGADELATLDGGAAVKACRAALAIHPDDPRLKLQLGFALLADVNGRVKVASDDPQAPPLARESIDLLKQSSKAGNMAARTLLGFTTIEGSDETAKPAGLAELREAAAAGNGFAHDVLGYAYEQGLGVAVDKAEALNWYRKGADLGDPGSKADYDRLSAETAPATPTGPTAPVAAAPAEQAPSTPAVPAVPTPDKQGANTPDAAANTAAADCDRLAALSFDTTRPPGVPGIPLRAIHDIDVGSAVPACRAALAANPQDPRLMMQLGVALIHTSDVDRDKTGGEAIRLVRQAAQAGNVAAMALLGTFYLETHDAEHQAEGLDLVRKAADGGIAFTMTALGSAYEFGDRVDPDKAQAEAWYRKAIAAGDEDAKGRLDHLLQSMGPPKPFILPPGATLALKSGTAKPVNVVQIAADGRTALMAGDGMIVLWDLTHGTVVRSFAAPTGDVHALALSPDSNMVLSAGYSNAVSLWDITTGQAVKSLDTKSDWPSGAAFTKDGATAIVAENEMIGLWDVATGRLVRELKGHRDSVEALTVSPDGKLMASASRDNTVRMWSLPAGTPVRAMKGSTNALSAESVAFAPDGKTLVFGGYDGTIALWDVTSGRALRNFKGLTSTIYSLAFSADGRSLLSGTGDGALKLWDVASGKLRQSFEGHTASVGSVAFSPDGRTVLSGSRDGTMRLWDAATGRPLATYFASESSWGSFNADGLFVTSSDPGNVIALKQAGGDLATDELIARNRRNALPDVLSATN